MGDLYTDLQALDAAQTTLQDEIASTLTAKVDAGLEKANASIEKLAAAEQQSTTTLTDGLAAANSKTKAVNDAVVALAAASAAADAKLGTRIDGVANKVGDDLQATIKELTEATEKAQKATDAITTALHGSMSAFPGVRAH